MSPTVPLPTPPSSSPPRVTTPDVILPSTYDTPATARPPTILRPLRPDPISLEDVTPYFLRSGMDHMEAPLVLRNVTPTAFDAWRSLHPDLIEDPTVRYEYNSLTSRMIVKCMPYPIHDSLQIFMCQRITEALCGSRAQGKVRCGSGTTFMGFTGDYAFQSQKLPDAYVRVSKAAEFPTVVAEAGWAEDLPRLIEDAKLWVEGSGYLTRVVLLTAFTEVEAGAGERVDGGETEVELMRAVDEGMTEAVLAPRLLALHRRNCLAEPLLGTVHATIHVYRVDNENNLYEDFTAVVLPAPQPSEADEAAEDTDDLMPDSDTDSSASSVSSAFEPDFYLTLQDLFGTFPPPRKMDPSFRVGFSMREFRKIIAEQVPAMEQCRAVMRAVKVLKHKGMGDDRETFAMMKSKKRKERV